MNGKNMFCLTFSVAHFSRQIFNALTCSILTHFNEFTKPHGKLASEKVIKLGPAKKKYGTKENMKYYLEVIGT